ncbi:MAG: tetratricopeptide repeat protein, partial [Abitibacteriaceae bacterium]|nr:tetratricopeptide repeat protein [Abditibacteriaceae bacterium]
MGKKTDASVPRHGKWYIELFGGLTARRGKVVVNHFRTQKTAALLAYLAYFAQAQPREALIELLWPDSDPARGRESLRTALAALRRQLEPDQSDRGRVLVATHHAILLNPDAITTDVLEFESGVNSSLRLSDDHAKLEPLTATLQLYRGPLLKGYYEDWIPLEEERLAELYCRAVLEGADLWQRVGNLDAALAAVQQAVALHPLREELQCRLMQLHCQNGQPAAALLHYQQYQQLLQQWHSIPGAEVRGLAEAIARQVAQPGNLPVRRGQLIGRDSEMEAARNWILQDHAGLLTLTGPGGVGKTSLALKVASAVATQFPDGVFFVALSPICDPMLVLPLVAQTLKVSEEQSATLLQNLQTHLRHKKILLLLDNFEQVSGAAVLVAELLSACPHLCVLVTSRVALNLWHEQEVCVQPLTLPELKDASHLDRLLSNPTVQLFLQRARGVQPDFEVTSENSRAVAEICLHLDGLPLAIELAASRMNLLSAAELLARLDDRFQILRTNAPNLPARHRTLYSVIDWSYSLLSPEHQSLLGRLAVFAGSFTLPAAEDVAGQNVLAGLDELHHHSLIHTSASPINTQTRYWLLESVRDYALHKLSLDDLVQLEVQGRHAIYFLEFAEQCLSLMRTRDEAMALAQLSLELNNLRVALQWTQQNRQPLLCVRLAIALHQVLLQQGYCSEARQCLDIGEAAVKSLQGDVRIWEAKIAYHQASLAHDMGHLSAALEAAQRSLTLCQVVDDRPSLAETLNLLGLILTDSGDLAQAQHCFEQSLTFRTDSDHQGRAKCSHNLARLASRQGDLTAARQLYEQSLADRRATGDLRGEAATLGNLGVLAFQNRAWAEADQLYRASLNLYAALSHQPGIAIMLNNLAEIAETRGQVEQAALLFAHAERIWLHLQSNQATIA